MEPRQRPVVIQGELAERMLRATETMVQLKQDVEALKRSDQETATTLRGTREYDGLVARVRDMERLLKEIADDFSEHRKSCSEEKREGTKGRREWRIAMWTGGSALFLEFLRFLASLPAATPKGH